METLLQEKIEAEARKKLSKWRSNDAIRRRKFERYQKKTGMCGPYFPMGQPRSWTQSPQFNPAYCIKHARYLAKVIVRKVRERTYEPQPSIRIELDKPSGGTREIDYFSIPDTALCTLLSSSVRLRNDKSLSAYSYAYRDGVKPLDAVSRLSSFIHAEKVFVSKYDFKDYFGSVSHDYIDREILSSRKFKITSFERTVIDAVIRHQFTKRDGTVMRRSIGFPQGNSLSLFLANAVGDRLDSSLDKANGNYVRYADDSVVVSYSYEDSIGAIDAYSDFSRETGVKINRNKESGISLVADKPGEMRTASGVDFLGYHISKSRVHLSDAAMSAIKKRCSRVIYDNLLMYPRKLGYIPAKRFDRFGTDWDLLACITELRLMLYGDRSHRAIERYLVGRSRIKSISSQISYYCLVDRVDAFAQLDGWLLWAIKRAVDERQRLIASIHPTVGWVAPSKSELMTGHWLRAHRRFDGRVPSFALAWRASRKALYSYGHLGVYGGEDIYDGT